MGYSLDPTAVKERALRTWDKREGRRVQRRKPSWESDVSTQPHRRDRRSWPRKVRFGKEKCKHSEERGQNMASQSVAPARDKKPRRTGAECARGWVGNKEGEVCVRPRDSAGPRFRIKKQRRVKNSVILP